MNRLQKIINGIVWLIIGILGVYILGYGIKGQSLSKAAYTCMKVGTGREGSLQNAAAESHYSGLAMVDGEPRT